MPLFFLIFRVGRKKNKNMNKKNTIREIIKQLGYKFNHAWVINTRRHRLDNFKVGGWSKPEIWIDGRHIDQVTEGNLLDEVIEDLRAMATK